MIRNRIRREGSETKRSWLSQGRCVVSVGAAGLGALAACDSRALAADAVVAQQAHLAHLTSRRPQAWRATAVMLGNYIDQSVWNFA